MAADALNERAATRKEPRSASHGRSPVTDPSPARSPAVSAPLLSETDVAELVRTHYDLQKGAFVSRWTQEADWIRVSSRISQAPMWNHLARVSQDKFQVNDLGEQVCALLASHPERPVLYLVDAPADATPPPDLDQIKFESCDREAWMLFVRPGSGSSAERSDLRVRLARTEQEIADFSQAFRAAYGMISANLDNVFRPTPRRLQGTRGFRHYVLYRKRQPVCVASLLWTGNRACIYNVGTPPSARKQGFAAHLVSRMIRDSVALGHGRLFLQAESGSGAEKLYSRLGFVSVFTRTGYRVLDLASESRPAAQRIPQSDSETQSSFLEAIYSNRGPGSTPEKGRVPISCPAELGGAIETFSQGLGISSDAVWVGAWAIVLQRYSHQTKVAFGIRSAEGEAGGDGGLWRIQLDVPEAGQRDDWLKAVAAQLGERDHSTTRQAARRATQTLPWESVIDLLPDQPSDRRREAQALIECKVKSETASPELVYDRSRFDDLTATRLAEHLAALLPRMIEARQQPLSKFEILTASERQQMLVDWNASSIQGPQVEAVTRLFESAAAWKPEAMAVRLAVGIDRVGDGPSLTYEQLNHQANQLARLLERQGIGPEHVVGLYLERGLDMIVALLAILKARGICLPLDTSYPAERVQFMLSDAGAAVVLCQERTAARLQAGARTIILIDQQADLGSEARGNLELNSAPDSGAYIIYTSGSTGKPKGVLIEQHAIALHCLDTQTLYGLGPQDKVLQFNSLSFDAAFEQILTALISGATLVLRGPEVWTPRQLGQQVEVCELTVIDLPTAYWRQVMVEWSEDPALQPAHQPRLFIVGGEAMSPETLGIWRELPFNQARLINAYGPTETTITATAFELTPEYLTGELPKRVPIGRPRGARTAYILDEAGRPTPVGVPGELHIGGPLLARGYVNRPEITREKFIQNPLSDDSQDRLYKTGDLARYLPDGNIEFLGRADQQVKIRGFRIELGEIEAALLGHPKVGQAGVTLQEASGHRWLAAYLTARNGQSPSERELRDFLRQSIPEHMVPSRFLVLDAMPMLPGGKIDRRALPTLPDDAAESGLTGPRDPLELRLQLLFERILQRTGVGIDVSFFELGGDSLQALELIMELERVSGKSLPTETLYQAASVEALAKVLRRDQGSSQISSLVPLQTGGSRPPLFLVHTTPGDILGYGNLIYHLDPDQPCYGLQSAGLLRSEESHQTIEAMAACYVRLICSMESEGPYYLAGWCYGGIVAVEMARQLTKLGHTIAFLGLLETVAPAPPLSIYKYYVHRLACFLRMKPAHWARYFRSKIQYHRDSRMANRMRFRRLDRMETIDPAALEEQNRRLAQLEHVYNTNLAALKKYRARPYPGTVTLFNAHEVDPGVIPDPLYAWAGLAKEIRVHSVPGDHDTMLTEPNVAVLARSLEACLCAAQSAHRKTGPSNELSSRELSGMQRL